MNIFDNIQNAANKVGIHAKSKFDTTKLEIKIKTYSNEIKELLMKIGVMIYDVESTGISIDENELNRICSSIDALKNQVKSFETEISKIKVDKESKMSEKIREQKMVIDNRDQKKYTKIDIKQEDLRVIRTKEGIKILRFCPVCNTGNSPNEQVCIACGTLLKQKAE